MDAISAETARNTKVRLVRVKRVLQELNHEEPKLNYQGDPIPTTTQRLGPLAAWVIYCSGNGAENEHLALIGAPKEGGGYERAYLMTPTQNLVVGPLYNSSFYPSHDGLGFDEFIALPSGASLLDGVIDLLRRVVPGTINFSKARVAFNWCHEYPRHDTIGYATLHRLRQAIVQRYDLGLTVIEGLPDPKDPCHETQPTHYVQESSDPSLYRHFHGSAEFHWEQRFPSAYPIIQRLEALTKDATRTEAP